MNKARCDESSIVNGFARVFPLEYREWAKAYCAEFHHIDDRDARLSWMIGGAALLGRCWIKRVAGQPEAWLVAAFCGVAIASIDLRVANSRLPLTLLGLCVPFVLGFLYSGSSWRWGAVVGISVPALAWWTRFEGPYFYDRTDAWYALVPAILSSVAGAWVRNRIRRSPHKDSTCQPVAPS